MSKNLVKLMVIFFSLSVYQLNIFGLPFTIDRFFLLLAIPLAFIFGLEKASKSVSFDSFIYTLFICYALAISFLHGSDFGAYGSMLVISLMYFFVWKTLIIKSNIELSDLYVALNATTIIIFSFTVFTISTFLFTGQPPKSLPLADALPFVTANGGHIIESGGFGLGMLTRVALPFGRPQELGMTCAVLFMLVIGSHRNPPKVILLFLLICIALSASRSAIFPFIVSLSIYYINANGVLRYFSAWGRAVIVFLAVVVVCYGLAPKFFTDSLQILESFSRLFQVFSGESSVQHLSVRGLALERVVSNPLQIIYGSGVGSFKTETGITSAHSTYITLLHDLGLIGLILFLAPIVFLGKKAFEQRSSYPLRFAIIIFIFLSHLLYEVPNLIIFWIALGLLSAEISRTRGRVTLT